MSSFDFTKLFSGKMEKGVGSEYLEGTAVTRLWFGVLVGYCRGKMVVMFD
jgi:hypothetical protein